MTHTPLPFCRWPFVSALVVATICALAGPVAAQAPPVAPRTDLDILMEEVLANRDETWKHLRDYVLDERERFALVGPDGARLFGQDRGYTWYTRDGMGVRSPVTANGVTVSEDERRRYEDEWVRSEQRREARQGERRGIRIEIGTGKAKEPTVDVTQPATSDATTPEESATPTLADSLEPRFVSEAFFLRFRFEPGNYFFAGRDTLDGRPVLKVEYLPTKLYTDEHDDETHTNDAEEIAMERKLNKVAMVTLWIDQDAKQIVRYTFDNVDFGFLPGRSLVRLDGARASMTMATVLDGVWMPSAIAMDGSVTLATGTFRIDYRREFSGYRRGETSATIRVREDR